MPSTTSTLAPPLVSGPSRPQEGSAAPRAPQAPERQPPERRGAVAERPLVLTPPESAAAERAPLALALSSPPEPPLAAPAAPSLAAPLGTVHVVIVHHRGLEMLEACLESLLASENVALEIVVVLNHCLEPVPELARTSPAVHLLELATSHGFGEANNLGVAFAQRQLGPADYYYFVNNDTLSRPDTLPRLVAELAAAPVAAIAGPQTLIQSAPDFINSLGLNVTEDAWGWDEGIGIALCDYGPLPGVRQVMAVTGSALLAEAAAFAQIGGWSEVYDYYFEDIDLGIKAWKRGRQVLHVPGSVIYHRVSATMTVGAERKFFFFWRNRLLLAGIHWPLGLLLAVLKRAVVAEVIRRPWSDSSLQRRALFGALRKMPGILRERWRQRSAEDEGLWRRFLRPAGSVPRISLPQPGEKPASRLAAEAAAVADPGEAPETGEDGTSEATQISPLPSAMHLAGPSPAAVTKRAPVVDAALESHLRALAPARPAGRRLLVFGWSPLPFENQRMNYAPGTRSWQFASALAADGHAVVLACAPIPGATFAPPPPLELEQRQGVTIVRLDLPAMEDGAERERLVRAFAPQALIGAAPGPSAWAAESAGELPLWVDLFGDPMAEGQAREAVYPGIESFGAYAGQVAPLLRRGDVFSAVSRRQRLAVIGQLGLAARLRGAAAGHELVRVLPCAAEPEEARAGDPASGDDVLPGTDFLVFWGGGFNTWCDVPILVAGLEAAMDERPEMVFVATGGEISGHDDRTAEDFRARVAASRHAERFRLLGQVPREQAEAWQRRADLALITEKKLYERELGSSGRVSGWLAAGRAILCSSCSELAADLGRQDLLLTYAPGDAEDLARQLVAAASAPERLRELAERAGDYARRHLTYAATTAPLRAWAQDPRRAPRAAGSPPAGGRSFLVHQEVREIEAALDERDERIGGLEAEGAGLRGELAALESRREDLEEEQARLGRELEASRDSFHRLRSELGQIHQSRMWRIWMAYLGARQRLGRLLGRGK